MQNCVLHLQVCDLFTDMLLLQQFVLHIRLDLKVETRQSAAAFVQLIENSQDMINLRQYLLKCLPGM